MAATRSKTKLTPPELAAMWGVSACKVRRLVQSGELRGINLATPGSTRPRILIDLADIAAFETARTIVPGSAAHVHRKLRRNTAGTSKDYFPS